MPTAGASTRTTRRADRHATGYDLPLVSLGLAWCAVVLLAAGVLLAGHVLTAMAILDASLPVFVVAGVSAPLFARLPLAWPTRAAALGLAAGWLMAAPLDALVRAGMHALDGTADPDGFFPGTWLWALPSLLVALLVASLRDRHARRRRL